jgi:hypothetical protein
VTRALICWVLIADAAFKKSLLSEGLDSSYRGIRSMCTQRVVRGRERESVCVCWLCFSLFCDEVWRQGALLSEPLLSSSYILSLSFFSL